MHLDNLTNPELVTVAVALLGGDVEYIDREDIAVKVNDIVSGRFTWRKYPERIDLDAVGVALRDAKKPKNGELLVGNNSQGWMLSPHGMRWIKNLNIGALLDEESTKQRKYSIYANQDVERTRLRNTRAFQLYSDGKLGDTSIQDFHEFARINEYFQTKARQKRFAVVDNAVVGDDTLSTLWNLLKERFSGEMT